MKISIFLKISLSFVILFLTISGMSVMLLRAYRQLVTTSVSQALASAEAIDAARSLQVAFKWQVQEWKDLLLRGDDPQQLDQYANAFLQRAEDVRKQIAALETLDVSSSNRAVLQQFSAEYQQMQDRYFAGLNNFRAARGSNYHEIDTAVKGMDRVPTNLLDTFVETVRKEALQHHAGLMQQIADTFYLTIWWLLGALCLTIAMSVVIARNIAHPLKRLSQVFSQVAQGNVRVSFPKAGRDETGELVASAQDMTAYLQHATELTRRLAQQDWQVEVTPKSEHDVLNQSLQVMIQTLQHMQAENRQTLDALEEQNRAIVAQNWHKDGISRLNAALAGELSLKALCDLAVQTVAHYLHAGRGVLYVHHGDARTVEVQGTFAFTERDALNKAYQFGEGIIGQVAAEQRAIYLKHLPVEQSLILTGTTYEAPLNTYTVPLLYNANLYGVMEIAAFEVLGAREQAFCDEAGQVIAVRLFSTMQRERMYELLRQSEYQQEDMNIGTYGANF